MGDPLGALATILVGWHKAGLLDGWFKLLFGLVFSFWITFNTVTGGLLIGHFGWQVSIGGGMTSAAALAFVAYIRANQKLTSGIVIAVPQEVSKNEFDSKGSGPEVITASGKV